MKPWLWFVPLVLVGILLGLRRPQSSWSADATSAQLPLPSSSRFVGAASCAAAACHNANFARGQAGSEFTHWMTRDRHARAYETLFEASARNIQTRLRSKSKAHEDPRCLRCHVHPDYDARVAERIDYFKTDGVSCESCHGPAKHWLAAHTLPAWQRMSPADKQSRGMNDTQSPLGRVQTCIPCHVGAAGMEVDHELIAAGHPRLHFEFTAFHAMMPHHWPDAKDRDPDVHPRGRRDFEALAWVLGQLATAQASLELLAHRADDQHGNWPEFTEVDCFACHHQLTAASWRQQFGYANRKPGALPWTGVLALTPRAFQAIDERGDPDLIKRLATIQAQFDRGKPDAKTIAPSARQAAALLKTRLHKLATQPLTAPALDPLVEAILKLDAPKATTSWDEVTQIQLALAAMQSTRADMKLPPMRLDVQNPLLKPPLHLPKSYDNPRAFEPRSLRHRLNQSKT